MTNLRRAALMAFTAPLALGLAACSEDAGGELPEGEPIAAISAPEGQSWTETATVTEANGYIMGNPDAPIKLMEYASLTCGACANFAAQGAEPLKEKYVSTGVVSYEIRNQIHNGIDLVLARLVRCSADESFHPLADQVWANLGPILDRAQSNPQGIEQAMALPEDQRFVQVAENTGLLEFFAQRGVSEDQARTCLADAASVQAIAERSDQQSAELGVNSTPTFFLNGQKLEVRSWAEIEPLLQAAGAR